MRKKCEFGESEYSNIYLFFYDKNKYLNIMYVFDVVNNW